MVAHKFCFCLGSLLFGLVVFSAPLSAALVQTGNVEPDINAWNSSTAGFVGRSSSGSMSVDAGSLLASSRGFLGYNVGRVGTVTVTGAGSTWTNGGELQVGRDGVGFLMIEAGGQVSNTTAYIGRYVGSTGTATVTGTGSKWTNSGWLYVSDNGSGKLAVLDGGEVVARGLLASLNDLLGNGTITATHGAILDADLLFDAAHGTQASVPFGSGGTLTVQAAGSDLGLGFRYNGSLIVSEGVSIYSSNGTLGESSGSTGTAMITGEGSAWTIEYAVTVGRYGSGALTIEAGGQVSNAFGYLGASSGSTGTVMVTGAGSAWTSAGALYVGREGNGSLTIEAGGQVSNSSGYLGYGSDATGTVIVTGAGSKWTNSGVLTFGGDPNDIDTLQGDGGVGTLTVADGGEVTAGALYGSANNFFGDGTITVANGGHVDADLVFDGSHGTQASAPFGSGGTLLFNVDGGSLGVGYLQSGSMTVTNGVGIASSEGFLGEGRGSTGTATVSGPGSNWTITPATLHGGELTVGWLGSGTLTIEAGAHVSNRYGAVGRFTGSTGSVTVTGAGSQWTNSDDLTVGSFGNGTLTIEAGGHVSNNRGKIGNFKSLGASGTAVVTGTGSQWINSGDLEIGSYGRGTLTIEAGGYVSNTQGVLGEIDDPEIGTGAGTVTVTGVGSRWTNTESLIVGREGSGTLNITDGGLVSVAGPLTIDSDFDTNDGDWYWEGNGFINMDTGGMLALLGDADDSLDQFFDLVSGTDGIRYWDSSFMDWSPLTEATYGDDYTLSYVTEGDLSGYTLLTVGTVGGIEGDFDGDGDVDGRDFLAWQRDPSLGSLADWHAAYGGSSELESSSASVPEPAALALGSIGLVLLSMRRVGVRDLFA